MNLKPVSSTARAAKTNLFAEERLPWRDPAFNSWGGLTFHIAIRNLQTKKCSAGHLFNGVDGAESWCRCGLKVYVDTCGLGHKDENECATAQQNVYGMHIAYHAQMFAQMANQALNK